MKRREFLLSAGTLAGVTILPRSLLAGAAGILGTRAARAFLAVARGRHHGALVRRAVGALGMPGGLARAGERVLLKPALAWNRAPGQGANVHPEVLRAVLELVLEAGAKEVVLFDRTSLRPDAVYRMSGAARVVREIGDHRVRLVVLREADFVPFRGRGGAALADGQGVLASLKVARHLLEADRVVNLATARHHPTRKVSLAFSNLLGLAGGWSPEGTWGPRQETRLALLAAAARPELTVLDATRPILRNGPAGRGPDDVGRWDTIAASRDPLAVEAFGACLFGLEPAELGHVKAAEELGLGSAATRGRIAEV